ncbi:uncharacterized protein L201_006010 [Kwoniella dendrophila CBS 6074]|uniref:F-box domain-containing protein n=1 Tax=Kwoniella dendrophila CBS 6074 TaxID=1295534 RepID=A0AAX4K1L8_9TREE
MPRKGKSTIPILDIHAAGQSPIERLPLELKLRVVSYLSVLDAHNLALVSRSLQDVAESIIWSRIDMSLPADWDKQFSLWEEDMPSWEELEDLTLTSEIENILNDFSSIMATEGGSGGNHWSIVESGVCWNLRTLKFKSRIKQVYRALSDNPQRSNHVKELLMELPESGFDEDEDGKDIQTKMVSMCESVRGNLRMVKIGSSNVNSRINSWKKPELDISTFLKAIGLTSCHLTKLQILEIASRVTPSLDTQLSNIFDIIGNNTIEHLIINPSWPNSSYVNTDILVPKLPLLQKLEMNRVSPQSIKSICKLIKQAENLNEIRFDFTEVARLWQNGKDALTEVEIKTLKEHQNVKRLEWIGGIEARWWFERITSGTAKTGFDNVEMLVQSQAIECESETYIENIHLPPFPSLRAILVPCRTPEWYRHISAPDWAKAPPPRNSISPHVISHLRSSPNLLVVQFSCLSSSSIEDILDTSKWCDKRVNGVIIRNYVNEITGEEFYHLRRLELLTVKPKMYDITYKDKYRSMEECKTEEDVDHRWSNHTSFKNATLPPQILKKLYKSINEKQDWQIPKRNLHLPESAWEILRKWRITLPDKGIEARKIVTRRMARDLQ